MDCNSCKEAKETISRYVHEADLDRLERVNKRWFSAWLITFILFIASWAGFLYYESQWEVVTTTEISQEVDTGVGDAFVSGTGDIIYGESKTEGETN